MLQPLGSPIGNRNLLSKTKHNSGDAALSTIRVIGFAVTKQVILSRRNNHLH